MLTGVLFGEAAQVVLEVVNGDNRAYGVLLGQEVQVWVVKLKKVHKVRLTE